MTTVQQKAAAYDKQVAKRRVWSKNYRMAHPDKCKKWSADYRKRTADLLARARAAGLDK